MALIVCHEKLKWGITIRKSFQEYGGGILIQNLFQEFIQAQVHEPMRYPAAGSILKLVLIHHQCRCMLYAHTAKHSPVRRKPQKSKVGVSA
jgi:hypothetical protein